MIEQITINGKSYTVTPDEQGYYTVDLSGENSDTFTIDTRSICDSGIELSNVQINEGNKRKDFVLPTASVTETATGIYQSLSDLRLTLTNAEQGLRQELNLTVDGLADRIEQIDTNGTKQLQQTLVTVDGLRSDTVKAQQTADHATAAIHTLESTVDSLRSELSLVDETVDGKIKNKVSTLRQTIDELQNAISSVTQSADGQIDRKLSQITQTIDNLESKLNQLSKDADGNINAKLSQVTQTIDDLSSSVTSLQKSMDGLDYVTQSKLTQTADSLRSEISEAQSTADGANKQVSTLTQTAQGLQTSVKDLQRKQESQITQLDNLIQTQVTLDGVRSLIKQSERNIMLQVESYDLTGKEIVSRINLNPEAVRIAGKKIQIDGDTYITNATIKNSHIASLSADKLTAGTIDASKINVINLKAQNISGMDSNFIRTRWNGIASSVEINPDGLLSTASDRSQVYIQNGIMGVRNPNGASIGQIGYQYDGGSPTYTIRTTLGSHFEIWQTRDENNTYRIIQLEAGGSAYHNRALQSYFYGARVNVSGELRITGAGEDLRLNEGMIIGSYGIEFKHGGQIYTLSGGQATRVNGTRELQLLVNDAQKVKIDTTRVYFSQDINMQGHNVKGQSDARLKKNITAYDYDALSRISKVAFKTFQWKNDNRKDYGFIAQEVKDFAPEWISEEPDGMLAYSDTLLTKVALRGIQQLIEKVELLEEELHEIKTGTTTTD